MQSASSVFCVNNGLFVMKFQVAWKGGQTSWTKNYPNGSVELIDLTKYDVPAGTEVYPVVHVEAGSTVKGYPVVFDPNTLDQADYHVSGTTLNVHVDLQGGS